MENIEGPWDNDKRRVSSGSSAKIQNHDLNNSQIESCDESIFDDSLTYIPVYTHLITYDPVPIKRPVTPLIIKSLRADLRAESEMRKTPESKSSSQFDKSSKIKGKK
ncbi:hypothetical protein HCN44_011158 [Aphidius gifuensis]|uniref:Uncharacterized protein n=2 Tax=Aphidius gifuensis TaxID=684658 RepID=A0A835CSF6_APHGI|nr:uncharacterized protein LOC122851249 isoform X2 [Aphidius gifuensis]KAF7993889.1 hypothetical protein HCN44_011158 [Aphidius gifuensis]